MPAAAAATTNTSRACLGVMPHDRTQAGRDPCAFPRYPTGSVVSVGHDADGHDDRSSGYDRVPSEYLLRTRALELAPARPLTHCPAFLSAGRCVRGADCAYAHVAAPPAATTATNAPARFDAAALIGTAHRTGAPRHHPSPNALSSAVTATPMPWYARQHASPELCGGAPLHHSMPSMAPLGCSVAHAAMNASTNSTTSALEAIGGAGARAMAEAELSRLALPRPAEGRRRRRHRAGASRRASTALGSSTEDRSDTPIVPSPGCSGTSSLGSSAESAPAAASLTSTNPFKWRHNPYALSAPPSPAVGGEELLVAAATD